MHYKLCVIGAKDTSIQIADYIMKNLQKPDCIITVDQQSVNTKNISGFQSVDSFAQTNHIPVFKVKDYSMQDEQTHAFFENNTFDLAVCMGWQRLIPQYVLESFAYGIFGFHGSCGYLPFGRGRSPLNWSIIKGDGRFILNLFQYDTKADSPNVFSKRMFQINEHDTIRTLQYKTLLCSYEMVRELWDAYQQKNIVIDRESEDFNYLYTKRNQEDGKIDFTCRTREIYNLIRAVTKPFPGAFAYVGRLKPEIIKIWFAVPFDSILDFSKYKNGQIIEIFDSCPIIRTLDGSILVKDYEFPGDLAPGDVLY